MMTVPVRKTPTTQGETEEIPVIDVGTPPPETIESLVNAAEDRYRRQVSASVAILGIEKVRIMLSPLVRANVLTQDEIEACVMARSTLESAQRRLLSEREGEQALLELPAVPLRPAKSFDWESDAE